MTLNLLSDAFKKGNSSEEDLETIVTTRNTDEVYENMLASCEDKDATRRLLKVLLAANRPLNLDEMNDALSIRSAQDDLESMEKRRKPSMEKYIISLCGHFVRIIGGQDCFQSFVEYDYTPLRTIHFVHKTARDFLLNHPDGCTSIAPAHWKHSIYLHEAHLQFLMICCFALHHPLWEIPPRLRLHSLWGYAVEFWPLHGRSAYHGPETEGPIANIAEKLCTTDTPVFNEWYDIYCVKNSGDLIRPGRQGDLPKCVPWYNPYFANKTYAVARRNNRKFITASYLGQYALVQRMLQKEEADVNGVDYISGFTAMNCAFAQKHHNVWKLLRDKGANRDLVQLNMKHVGPSGSPSIEIQHINELGDKNLIESLLLRSDESHESLCILFDTRLRCGYLVSQNYIAKQIAEKVLQNGLPVQRRVESLITGGPVRVLKITRSSTRTADKALGASLDFIWEIARFQRKIAAEYQTERNFWIPDMEEENGSVAQVPETGYNLVGCEYLEVLQMKRRLHVKWVTLERLPIWWEHSFTCPVLFGQFAKLTNTYS